MKVIITTALACIVMLGCAKKDHVCTCTVNGDEYTKTIPNSTQGNANSDCTEYGKSIGQTYYNGNYTYKCVTK
jgi:hypothetical protein